MTGGGDDEEALPLDSAKARVETWLRENGVALEMQVASAFRAALRETTTIYGDVDLGRTYVGREIGSSEMKRRETDVVVQVTRRTFSGAYLSLWLVIECKSSVKDPWVLYRSAGRQEPSPTVITQTGWEVRAVDGLKLDNVGGWYGSALAATNRRPCYAAASTNTKDSGGNQKNHARDALLQVSSALLGVADDVLIEHDFRTAAVLLPVVVTAAPLFAVSMTEDGTPHVERTTHEMVTTRFSATDTEARWVWIVSVDWLEDLVNNFMQLARDLDYRP